MIILYIAYQYKPGNREPLSLSFTFNGPQGANELVTTGTVRVSIKEYRASRKIDEDGNVLFTGIDANYHGEKINLSLDIPEYFLKSPASYKLSDSSRFTEFTVALDKATDSVNVQGRVFELSSKEGISNAEIRFQGSSSIYKSDSLGNFSFVLPFKNGYETRVVVTKGKKELYNSLRTISKADFLSIAVD
ncbi:hypothetical protein GS399_01530 [Pedobacter sp. HMF7647]|uniref:Uncharacterized protein n=1 Tax=Hufsiella arboris TaxID=2695275 RepID=A0A7K1Y4X7_9SPHI|nr:hypothetical protein [Hufsiella arboris]MXV49637.1 hypothetical protein [Hufsiella arboris]